MQLNKLTVYMTQKQLRMNDLQAYIFIGNVGSNLLPKNTLRKTLHFMKIIQKSYKRKKGD